MAMILALQFFTAAGLSDVDLSVAPTVIDPYVRVYGASTTDGLGNSVANAGDVNNDGYSDILVGAYQADPPSRSNAGITYLIFGKAGATNSTIDTAASLTSATGIKILGPAASNGLGRSVSSLGDLNKDGYDDFVIGVSSYSPPSRSGAGGALVIFGKATASWADIDTSTAVPAAGVGYWIYGAAASDGAGISVGAAGDVNGDGNPDIIIGATGVDRNSINGVGGAYVIFGQGAATTATNIDLATFTSTETNGFRIYGTTAVESCGSSVSGAGDVNNDGYDDVLVGCTITTYSGKTAAGSVFVLFGHSSATPYIDLNLAAMTTTYGFVIYGPTAVANLGNAVSSAGDINADGFDDFIVGAYRAAPSGRSTGGAAYVIFGRSSGFADINLATFASGSAGFRVIGAAGDFLGISVGGGADVSGDGVDDVVVGCNNADPPSRSNAGISYVILGQPSSYTFTDVDTASLTSAQGSKILGAAASDNLGASVAVVPDFNGDGSADVLVGATGADPLSRSTAGTAYLLYGEAAPTSAPIIAPTAGPTEPPTTPPTVVPSADPSTAPTVSPTLDPTLAPLAAPSVAPTPIPSESPTAAPSADPSAAPTTSPTLDPTLAPSAAPTAAPTPIPSESPTAAPSVDPSAAPTASPTLDPTLPPSAYPTAAPTPIPSETPTAAPSADPSSAPTASPTLDPTLAPSAYPTAVPTPTPSETPTAAPSADPSSAPTASPTLDPTLAPSAYPTAAPTPIPSETPTAAPSADPSSAPTTSPTLDPTLAPSAAPSAAPTPIPSELPTPSPTLDPTTVPTQDPTNAVVPAVNSCAAGSYFTEHADSTASCTPCPKGTYADESGASACQDCSYPYGTVDTGSSQCDTVQVGLPDVGMAALFGLTGVFVLSCLATQAASLTAAVVGMVLVSTLDLLTDLVYIVSAKFVTGTVFGLCVAFFLLRAAPFLYRLYEMGHWYPCFRASFYTMPEWAAAGERSPVTAALVLGMVLAYPLHLACHLVFAAVWLVVGCFLHLTGVMALQRVKEFWVQVWRRERTAAFSAPAATQAATPALPVAGTNLMVLAMFVALPEIILQLYNQEKVGYTAIGIISVIASGLVILSCITAAAEVLFGGRTTPAQGSYELALSAAAAPADEPTASAGDAPATTVVDGSMQLV